MARAPATVDLLMTHGGRVARLFAARFPTMLRGTGCMLARRLPQIPLRNNQCSMLFIREALRH